MTPLFPPSSMMERPKRAAMRPAASFPTAVDPVRETRGMRASSAMGSPTSAPLPMTRLNTPCQPVSARTRSTMRVTASAQSGVGEAGFQSTTSPQTPARKAFQAHTATGKLKAEMTPTVPRGCHCSVIRWRGRSLCMTRP